MNESRCWPHPEPTGLLLSLLNRTNSWERSSRSCRETDEQAVCIMCVCIAHPAALTSTQGGLHYPESINVSPLTDLKRVFCVFRLVFEFVQLQKKTQQPSDLCVKTLDQNTSEG